jgi:hypothetical protein
MAIHKVNDALMEIVEDMDVQEDLSLLEKLSGLTHFSDTNYHTKWKRTEEVDPVVNEWIDQVVSEYDEDNQDDSD